MATGTNNPPGSTDPRDLYANAQNLDLLLTGPQPFYPDRLGVQRYSWNGMEFDFNAAQSGRQIAFQQFLAASGFEAPVSYATGVVLDRVTQTFVRNNIQYRIKDPADLPYTITGDWEMESEYFASMGDSGLRQDLAGSNGGELIGFKGGTLSGFIERTVGRTIYVTDFGAIGDGVTDDTQAIQAAFDSVANAFNGWVRDPEIPYFGSSTIDGLSAHVHFPRGFYKVTEEIKIPRGIKITGENARNHGGSRVKQFGAGGKYCFDLYGFRTPNGQYIADQQIDGLFFSAVDGGGIRAYKPDGSTDFHSPGSLSISNCFFLDISSPLNTQYAAIDCDYIERVENNTFDAIEAIGLRCSSVSICTGNTFFFNARGGVILDRRRVYGEQVPTMISTNTFLGCGGSGAGGTGPYQAAIGLIGNSPADVYEGIHISTNSFGGVNQGGIHGVVSENVDLFGASIINNFFTNLKGDPIRLASAQSCQISNVYTRCGDSSLGVYVLGILGRSKDCVFQHNIFTGNFGVKNIHLGADSSGNLFNGTVQDSDRFECPIGYGTRLNDFAGGVPAVPIPGGATAWGRLTLSNQWVDYSTDRQLEYRRTPSGEVIFRGAIKNGAIGSLLSTLPVGFRPKSEVNFTVCAGASPNTYGRVAINQVGDMYVLGISDNNGSMVDFSSVRFFAE